MLTLKDIKRRITSVRKTQQITRAMRMVAGAKLRRAQEAIESARPYADRMRATLAEVARAQRDSDHPLLVPHPEVRNVELFVVTSDRGLCGAFNANLIKEARLVGVKVTGVYPGGVNTAFRATARPDYLRPESAARMIVQCITAPDDVVVHELTYRPIVETNF